MLSDHLPASPSVFPENAGRVASDASRSGFVTQIRGLLATRPIRALSREEWEDVRRKLAPYRPPQPPRRFGPPAGLFC